MKHYVAIFMLFTFISCHHQTGKKDQVLIAAASNVLFPMEQIIAEFEIKYDIECELVSNSSGMLTAQIIEGAPYDVFISADMKYPEFLCQEGKCDSLPDIYAYGKLILWTMNEEILLDSSGLVSSDVERIAIPNPKNAPYGKAAIEYLQKKQIYEQVKHKLVFGENVNQTNQFIYSQSVDLGFTAKSIIKNPSITNKGKWKEIDENSYTAIEQGIICISKNKDSTKFQHARNFKQFMFSKKAQEILQSYGYQTPF